MKLRNTLALFTGVLVLSATFGRAQPLVRISFKSLGEVSNAVVRVAGPIAKQSPEELGQKFTEGLGLAKTTAFDANGAWELAVWPKLGDPKPLVALKGPISDIKKFQSQLSEEGALAKAGKEWVQLQKGTAAIVFKAASDQSDEEKAELKRWEERTIVSPRRAVELTLAPSEELKTQLLPFLGMARMSMSQIASVGTPGTNPKAMGQIFDIYFDAIETFIKGLAELKLSAGVEPESLVVEETVSAKPDTELAKWIRKPANPLKPEDVKGLRPDALFSGAMSLDKTPRVMDLVGKFMKASLEMQNASTNGMSAEELTKLVAVCLPMRVSGSVFMKGHISFEAAYRFPGREASAVYSEMKPLIKQLVETQAGEGKVYSAASFKEKDHTVAGVPVDQYSFTFNLDNPLFQQPGQKEAIKAMWQDGKMEFDYAVRDNELLAASPERMKDLLNAAQPSGASAIATDDSTVAAGYFNLLSVVRDFVAANPMVPEQAREKLAKLDPAGAGIRFHLRMTSKVSCEARVPLKLFSQLGQLKDEH